LDFTDIAQDVFSEWGESRLHHYLDVLTNSIECLSLSPDAFPEQSELASGVRSLPCNDYEIFYRSDDLRIVVLRILHEQRVPIQ